MVIDQQLIDTVTARAQTSPRLRMNYNFHLVFCPFVFVPQRRPQDYNIRCANN